MKKLLPACLLPALLLSHMSRAQDKWDLKRCVDYAVANNISVKQSDVQARLAALTLQQSKLVQLPTLSFNGNVGVNSGHSQDPTTFNLITESYLFNQYGMQAGINFFNFNSLKYNAQGNQFALAAANAATDKLRSDISLNVANAYLQFLLSYQQSKTAQVQLSQSQEQLEITRKQVAAGSLPELNAAELEAQLAQDSSAYITTVSNVQQAVLNLKAYMSIDAAATFKLDTPAVEKIPVESFAELQPDIVFSMALNNQPQQRADSFQILAAKRFVDANGAARYPTFSLFGSMNTTYTNQTGFGLTKQPYFDQLNTNFRQSAGLSVNVPILNGGGLRINYERSKVNLQNYKLQQELDNLTLKQNIYQAYNLAVAAYQKFEANKRTVEATQRSYDYAQKRYKVGMLNTIDLLTNQNNSYKAKIDLLYSQFDYVFKMKVLEFYKGLGIKL